ncbi:uncharacterized protein LY89DRAFT_733559 [Mollisia scopiformis]|uniref:Uncharacterized protein n=1 Tax=Mollisia scopiformis TaxID=149040 RepID=A0A194XDA3_MOLSC|nr:uncharacterized protein LY89DRAFT_733559 [Mollisia scopiformis]KUJ17732.1 hypothetical protein LY89DRAFT_733559 [Mollisia scopiformis]
MIEPGLNNTLISNSRSISSIQESSTSTSSNGSMTTSHNTRSALDTISSSSSIFLSSSSSLSSSIQCLKRPSTSAPVTSSISSSALSSSNANSTSHQTSSHAYNSSTFSQRFSNTSQPLTSSSSSQTDISISSSSLTQAASSETSEDECWNPQSPYTAQEQQISYTGLVITASDQDQDNPPSLPTSDADQVPPDEPPVFPTLPPKENPPLPPVQTPAPAKNPPNAPQIVTNLPPAQNQQPNRSPPKDSEVLQGHQNNPFMLPATSPVQLHQQRPGPLIPPVAATSQKQQNPLLVTALASGKGQQNTPQVLQTTTAASIEASSQSHTLMESGKPLGTTSKPQALPLSSRSSKGSQVSPLRPSSSTKPGSRITIITTSTVSVNSTEYEYHITTLTRTIYVTNTPSGKKLEASGYSTPRSSRNLAAISSSSSLHSPSSNSQTLGGVHGPGSVHQVSTTSAKLGLSSYSTFHTSPGSPLSSSSLSLHLPFGNTQGSSVTHGSGFVNGVTTASGKVITEQSQFGSRSARASEVSPMVTGPRQMITVSTIVNSTSSGAPMSAKINDLSTKLSQNKTSTPANASS